MPKQTVGSLALDFEYINDVPWEQSPDFALKKNSSEYIEAFNKILDKLPETNSKISFYDDIWDFNPYMKTVHGKQLKFNFTDIPDNIKTYCKFYVLNEISGYTKVTSAHSHYNRFRSAITNIIKRTNHKNILLITQDDIENECTRRNLSAQTSHEYYLALYNMYFFFINICQMKLPVHPDWLMEQNKKYEKLIRKRNKGEILTPDIPNEYFDIIINKCIEVMRDKKQPLNMRMIAAATIFISQTGLRLGDFLALTTDCLHTRKLPKSGLKANYIHFAEHKPSKPHRPLLEFDVFCNELCTEAFNTMKKLRKESLSSEGNDILFILTNKKKNSKEKIPYPLDRFRKLYQLFFKEHLYIEASTEWQGIKRIHVPYDIPTEKINGYPTMLYIPDIRQYRVHLCTELYNKGVSLVYIQRYMGHLSESMIGYYVRPKDTYQENIEYSEKVIREIVEEDTAPIGGNLLGDDIKTNIKKFISDNHFNVKTDMDDIMNALGDKIAIRAKTGGVCIKTSFIPCSRDARTNNVLCAYNVCPNLFTLYTMVDVTYMDFLNLQSTYTAMKQNGHTKEAQKEFTKLKQLTKNKLIPELDELDREINVNGVDTILNRHPSLIDIIENRTDIRKEAQKVLK